MSTLTIRLPDDKHERLKALARSNSISINKLIDELATVAQSCPLEKLSASEPRHATVPAHCCVPGEGACACKRGG